MKAIIKARHNDVAIVTNFYSEVRLDLVIDGCGDPYVCLTPEQARRLARKLKKAARRAERGEDQ